MSELGEREGGSSAYAALGSAERCRFRSGSWAGLGARRGADSPDTHPRPAPPRGVTAERPPRLPLPASLAVQPPFPGRGGTALSLSLDAMGTDESADQSLPSCGGPPCGGRPMKGGGGRAVGAVAAVAGGRARRAAPRARPFAPPMAAAARDPLSATGLDEADEAVRGTCEDASVCKR